MGGTFFLSWELWEKMTFVLGAAIVAVFLIGYAKLCWRNRIVHKQELVDEEKRTRIQQLRSSGQLVESSKHDVPFGVRAIQSGIQVDGIWISNSNTPIPSQLNLAQMQSATTSDASTSPRNSQHAPLNAAKASSRKSRSPLRSESPLDRYADETPNDQSPGVRQSYKPRKSSHLRYGSYGDTRYNDDTLAQLEGKAIAPEKKVHVHRPRGSRQLDLEADASAADNEHSSGASSDSDATLSGNLRIPSDRQNRYSPGRNRGPGEGVPLVNLPTGRPVLDTFQFQSPRSEYSQVPLNDTPYSETSDPFLTPQGNDVDRNPLEYRMSGGMTSEYQPLPANVPAPFVPGQLHENKNVRKVNSGFEVLPAGTFGASTTAGPSSHNNGRYDPHEEESGERRGKLQKKPRTSMTGKRGSMDRP